MEEPGGLPSQGRRESDTTEATERACMHTNYIGLYITVTHPFHSLGLKPCHLLLYVR